MKNSDWLISLCFMPYALCKGLCSRPSQISILDAPIGYRIYEKNFLGPSHRTILQGNNFDSFYGVLCVILSLKIICIASKCLVKSRNERLPGKVPLHFFCEQTTFKFNGSQLWNLHDFRATNFRRCSLSLLKISYMGNGVRSSVTEVRGFGGFLRDNFVKTT